jgi:hypothetical protein
MSVQYIEAYVPLPESLHSRFPQQNPLGVGQPLVLCKETLQCLEASSNDTTHDTQHATVSELTDRAQDNHETRCAPKRAPFRARSPWGREAWPEHAAGPRPRPASPGLWGRTTGAEGRTSPRPSAPSCSLPPEELTTRTGYVVVLPLQRGTACIACMVRTSVASA